MEAVAELRDAVKPYEADRSRLHAALNSFGDKYGRELPALNDSQHAARQAFDPIADASRGLVKQVDLLHKLSARVTDLGSELASDEIVAAGYERRVVSGLAKQIVERRRVAVEQLKNAVYFHRQVTWLQDRFPEAELRAVPGLVKLRRPRGNRICRLEPDTRSVRWGGRARRR